MSSFGLTRASFGQEPESTVTTVSAASYEETPVAPNSIVAGFGPRLATQMASAADTDPQTPGIQLPEQLAGTTVEVNGRRAGLLYVSLEQVNYVIPAATETGSANVVVQSGDGTISRGTVVVARMAPAIFTANADGDGVPAATLLRVKADGTQSYESVSQFDQTSGRFATKPIDLGPTGDHVFLILFLSGIRPDSGGNNNLAEIVRLQMGADEVVPLYVGLQPDFTGLDQINAEIPRSLIGRGKVNVSVSVPGSAVSNLVEIEIAGAAGTAPPQVYGFSANSTLAGQALLINGTGFSSALTENIVYISGLEAKVKGSSSTQLTVTVPFGAESGTVRVRTTQGEGISPGALKVRTSISGVVEDTGQQAMAGLSVRVPGTEIVSVTNEEGGFVLPDVQPGLHFVEIDGGSLQTDPPYPTVTVKITAQSNRDNQFSHPIALQQQTGSSGLIGAANVASGSISRIQDDSDPTARIVSDGETGSTTIQTGDFVLELPDPVSATFPDGSSSGQIFLTPLNGARTPVALPRGFFSSAIVQITPFGVRIAEGGTLTFPNSDGFPAGAPATLFRYDPAEGRFVREAARAFVSSDGRSIRTESGAIKVTSYYFTAVPRPNTTMTGRVLEKDGQTAVPRAHAQFRGQESITDNDGSYLLRDVPVMDGEPVFVEVNYQRPTGRVERVISPIVPVFPGRTTRIPDVLLPDDGLNRPPIILAPPRIEIEEGRSYEFRLQVQDPDLGQRIEVRVEGADFASLVMGTAGPPGAFVLKLSPGISSAGQYTLVLTAADETGGTTRREISLIVRLPGEAKPPPKPGQPPPPGPGDPPPPPSAQSRI